MSSPRRRRRPRLREGAFKAVAAALRPGVLSVPSAVLLLAVATILPIITFMAAYHISGITTKGDIWRRKGYFLSAAIDLPPASNFATLGLTIALSALTGVVAVRHHVVNSRLTQPDMPSLPGIMRVHRISCGCALFAAIGGYGVAAYQHGANQMQNMAGHFQ